MPRSTWLLVLLTPGLLLACATRGAEDRPAEAALRSLSDRPCETCRCAEPGVLELPGAVDLRPKLLALGLDPRAQGPRGTCSIFTTCSAIEAALAEHRGHGTRLSPEFLNWAASQAGGWPSDGNFFHNALAGFERFGLCGEDSLPYRAVHDPLLTPEAEILEEAARLREESRDALAVHWIVPWVPDRFGVSDEQFEELRSVLARGYPVAAGSAHSRLLVGYRDDATAPGGGVFLTQDSALARFDEVSYAFVREQVADAFWVEARGETSAGPPLGR